MTAAALQDLPDDSGAFGRPNMAVLGPIVDKVLRMPEHRHLVENDARIEWLMRNEPKVKAGRQVLGTCYRPKVNGELSGMFDWLLEVYFGEFPDFLITLDASYWAEATPLEREILVFHELSHAVQAQDQYGAPKFDKDGNPVFAIVGHDIEEFNQVVARYGAHSPDVEAFVAAVQDGERHGVGGGRVRLVE